VKHAGFATLVALAVLTMSFAAAGSAAAAGTHDPPDDDTWHVVPTADANVAAGAARSPTVDGAHVAFFRGPEGAWLYLRAPTDVPVGASGPTLRVDGGAPIDLELARADYERLGLDFVRVTRREFAILLWPGAGPIGEPIRGVLAGRELRVSWVDTRGARRDVRFPLAGAAAALRTALRLDAEEPTVAAQSAAHGAITMALMRACSAPPATDRVAECLSAVAGCGQASVDAADLLTCASARGARLPRAWVERGAASR
jgi:hypothetical protein